MQYRALARNTEIPTKQLGKFYGGGVFEVQLWPTKALLTTAWWPHSRASGDFVQKANDWRIIQWQKRCICNKRPYIFIHALQRRWSWQEKLHLM